MENAFWVVIMILPALPPLAIFIPIVLIEAVLRLLNRILSLWTRRDEDAAGGSFLKNRPEPYG